MSFDRDINHISKISGRISNEVNIKLNNTKIQPKQINIDFAYSTNTHNNSHYRKSLNHEISIHTTE